MKRHFTMYAEAYVAKEREAVPVPSWADVARAYDMGLVHAVTRTGSQRKTLRDLLQALRVLNIHELKEGESA